MLPFERIEDLPESLKGLVSDGSESFYSPPKEIFTVSPGPEPGFIFQGAGSGQWVQRQASRTAAGMQEQIWAEQEVEAAERCQPKRKRRSQDQHGKAQRSGEGANRV